MKFTGVSGVYALGTAVLYQGEEWSPICLNVLPLDVNIHVCVCHINIYKCKLGVEKPSGIFVYLKSHYQQVDLHTKLKGVPSTVFLPKSCEISTGIILLCAQYQSNLFTFILLFC